jgi:drug/metabolite transporter (DMT)-like permease
MSTDHTRNASIALAFTMLVWGSTGVFVRAFSLTVGGLDALVIRSFLAAMVFVVILLLGPGFKIDLADLPRLAILAIIGMLGYYVGTNIGFSYAPASIGTLIFATQPLLITLLASMLGKEQVHTMTLFGLVISFLGTFVLFWGDITRGQATLTELVIGSLLIFGAGFAWAVYVVFSRSLIQKYGAIKVTALSSILMCLPLIVLVRSDMPTIVMALKPDALLALAILTFLGATASVITWNYAAGILKVSIVGSALYFVPQLGILAAWAYLGDPLTLQVVIAALIILLGVAVAQYGPLLFAQSSEVNP